MQCWWDGARGVRFRSGNSLSGEENLSLQKVTLFAYFSFHPFLPVLISAAHQLHSPKHILLSTEREQKHLATSLSAEVQREKSLLERGLKRPTMLNAGSIMLSIVWGLGGFWQGIPRPFLWQHFNKKLLKSRCLTKHLIEWEKSSLCALRSRLSLRETDFFKYCHTMHTNVTSEEEKSPQGCFSRATVNIFVHEGWCNRPYMCGETS